MSTASPPGETPCDVRFGQVGLACVRVRDANPAALCEDLERRVHAAPQMFTRTAVVLDMSHLPALPDDGTVDALLEAIRAAGMLPVGLAYGDSQTDALAQRMGLPVIARFREAFERAGITDHADATPAPDSAAEGDAPAPTSLTGQQHTRNVRSGQQIYARDRDLVITATVANGAEVIADGSIHVYGTLRGRALAGAQGDESARIFCTDFRPELVSIAGHYRVFEEIPRQFEGKAVQCRLEGEKLLIEKL
ncbi:MAG TPA: septum site-determining protein MinC [Rhodanobacteraceae bacterium]|nr:septum site-determining protein MinC [Rhodanobacteraceae bacterium]